jgi:hypothetical protein
MGRRTVRINLQTGNPDKFLELCKAIVEHNDALGASSPLASGDIIDMAAYSNTLAQAVEARESALELYARAEAAMAQSRQLMGMAPGQSSTTPGTLYNLTLQIKKLLLVLETENPEALSHWGFDVVIRMAKSRGKKKVAAKG